MKEIILLLFVYLQSGLLYSQPSIQWEKSYGGSGSDYAPSISQTSDSGFVIAGTTESNDSDVTIYHGNQDYWIVKTNSTGTIQWQKSLGGTDSDNPNAIQQTSDGSYIVAGSSISDDIDITGNHGQDDFWVVKLNSVGNIQWQKSLGGSNDDVAYSVQQTSSGGYIVAGSSKSSDGDITSHHGINILNDALVVNLDSAGNILWQKSLGGTDSDVAYSLIQTTDGGYVVAGQTSSTDGDVTGHHGTTINGDYWIVKLNNSGVIQWQKTLGGSLTEIAFSIQQTMDGGYIVAGDSYSSDGDVTVHYGSFVSNDYWIVKLDSMGNIVWEKTLGGTGTDMSTSIRQTTDGGYIVAGYTNSDDYDLIGLHGINFDYDYWVTKLNDTGSIQWQKLLGGTADDVATCILQTADDGFIVAGKTRSVNRDVTENNGQSDFWIVKLSSAVNIYENENSLLNFQILPNPFSNQTFITFSNLPLNKINIVIYDLGGRIIKRLFTENIYYNGNRLVWDATDNSGNKVESGIYFVTGASENSIQTKKVIVLKE